MNLNRGMMINIEGIECCILDVQNINETTYIYVAEILDEDITENFYVYKVISENKFEKVIDSDSLKSILPVFIESIQESL